jgi:hypothetical protein
MRYKKSFLIILLILMYSFSTLSLQCAFAEDTSTKKSSKMKRKPRRTKTTSKTPVVIGILVPIEPDKQLVPEDINTLHSISLQRFQAHYQQAASQNTENHETAISCPNVKACLPPDVKLKEENSKLIIADADFLAKIEEMLEKNYQSRHMGNITLNQIDGTPINSMQQIIAYLANKCPDQEITLYYSYNEKIDFTKISSQRTNIQKIKLISCTSEAPQVLEEGDAIKSKPLAPQNSVGVGDDSASLSGMKPIRAPDVLSKEKIFLTENLSNNYDTLVIKKFSADAVEYSNVNDEEKPTVIRLIPALQFNLAVSLKNALTQKGIFKHIVEGKGIAKERTVILEGSFTEFNAGNRAVRRLVGFGVGKTYIKVSGRLVDAATGKVLATFEEREAGYLGAMSMMDFQTLFPNQASSIGVNIAAFLAKLY